MDNSTHLWRFLHLKNEDPSAQIPSNSCYIIIFFENPFSKIVREESVFFNHERLKGIGNAKTDIRNCTVPFGDIVSQKYGA